MPVKAEVCVLVKDHPASLDLLSTSKAKHHDCMSPKSSLPPLECQERSTAPHLFRAAISKKVRKSIVEVDVSAG